MAEKKILVVSGDSTLLGFLEKNLPVNGYQVVSTRDTGERLKTVLDRVLPDLLVLDIMMPSLDGIEVCLRIRQWSEVPILMLTTWGAGKDKVRGLDLSSESYLTSPSGIAELTKQVEETLCNSTAPGNHHNTSLKLNNGGGHNQIVISAS